MSLNELTQFNTPNSVLDICWYNVIVDGILYLGPGLGGLVAQTDNVGNFTFGPFSESSPAYGNASGITTSSEALLLGDNVLSLASVHVDGTSVTYLGDGHSLQANTTGYYYIGATSSVPQVTYTYALQIFVNGVLSKSNSISNTAATNAFNQTVNVSEFVHLTSGDIVTLHINASNASSYSNTQIHVVYTNY